MDDAKKRYQNNLAFIVGLRPCNSKYYEKNGQARIIEHKTLERHWADDDEWLQAIRRIKNRFVSGASASIQDWNYEYYLEVRKVRNITEKLRKLEEEKNRPGPPVLVA